tara:strand:- start:472 stop:885 length:414 start_codon:yes stop_codon:yes gene_type:complete
MYIKLKSIKKSLKESKKLTALFEIKTSKGAKKFTEKKTSFGYNNPDDKQNDYRLHKDIDRRNQYIIRHQKDLRTDDPTRAGYLSMFMLWNKPTLEASVKDYNRRLKIYNETGKFPYEDLINEAEQMMKEKADKKKKE